MATRQPCFVYAEPISDTKFLQDGSDDVNVFYHFSTGQMKCNVRYSLNIPDFGSPIVDVSRITVPLGVVVEGTKPVGYQ